MTDLPRGYNSKEEYFADLERKSQSRKGSFYISLNSHGQTRQGRGTTTGQFGAFIPNAIGDSSLYDEAYGPSNLVRKHSGYSDGGSYDEGFIARRNSRDDAEAKEREGRKRNRTKGKRKKKKD